MCVIAAYIGSQRAAPILIDMMRREEGIDAGFYTGIVTLHQGKLHHEKVVGDLTTLLQTTPAADLPGDIGLIHSRTDSGGDREWGHPFIDTHNRMAYIANGAVGQFDKHRDLSPLTERLQARGYRFKSAVDGPVGKYPRLHNGQSIHISDLFCQAIAEAYERQEDHPQRLMAAAMEIYENHPGEIVGLCLHVNHPDQIVVTRHNKPMEIGMAEDGAIFLASTSMAFPGPMQWQMRMPAVSGATVHRNGGIEIRPFRKTVIPMGQPPSTADIADRVMPLLKTGEFVPMGDLREAARALWPAGVLGEREIAVYELLAPLLQDGRIELKNVKIPGVNGQGQVPRTQVRWTGPTQA